MNPKIGDIVSYKRVISPNEVLTFSKLSGDINPLHFDTKFSAETRFESPIIHGYLLSSLFSKIVGTMFGDKVLLLSQDSCYRNPAYTGDELEVKCQVKRIQKALNIIYLDSTISTQSVLILNGSISFKIL